MMAKVVNGIVRRNNGGFEKDGESIRCVYYNGVYTHIVETDDGKLYLYNDDEGCLEQINFDPLTGEPAKVKIGES
jgi:hypothetical protein